MAALERDPDRAFEIVGSTLAGGPDPGVAIAASRAGATGLLDLEHTVDPGAARAALDGLIAHGRGSLGVQLRATAPLADALIAELPPEVSLVVLSGTSLGATVDRLRTPGRRVFVECRSMDEARAAIKCGADGLVAKGAEAGGHVGEETTFILVQRLVRETEKPVLARGGIGLHTAPACAAAGVRGVVLDVQLGLARESNLPPPVRDALERMEGDETTCLGRDLGQVFRVYQRPGMRAAERLRELEASLDGGEPSRRRWAGALAEGVGWGDAQTHVWPLGQDAAFAARLARRFHTVAGIIEGVRRAVTDHVELARGQRTLGRGAPLARAHGTEYPILQGPMTRVSDTAAFAGAVADAGALPFLALALLRGPRVRELLLDTRERMGERPWGVGILGFVPRELREEQLAVIAEVRPRFAIIAGGRPDQAARLEAAGTSTYLHVPAPGLLRVFLEGGARRFIFEGRECGGHVGPRTSFVLWESAIDTLLDAVEGGVPAEDLHVVFAGGIHDDLSGAMVAAMAAPLVARGARVGVLLGSAYIFTEEAVASGAIVEGFQQQALRGDRTVLLESGPGHSTRCLATPFHEAFARTRRRLVGEGRPPEELRDELEALNLGRLRIASKGLARASVPGSEGPRYTPVDPEQQQREGLFMIGQVAAMRSRVCRMADLHENLSAGSAALLDACPRPVRRGSPAETARPVDVAIIGLGCLLPRAPDVETFWANVLGKVDAITEVPRERFDVDLYFDPDRKARDKVYSRWGGFLDDVPFDPMRYGIPPAALPSIDALQLLSLEVVRQALADAGYLDREFPRERTAVLLGLSGGLGDLGLGYGIRANLPGLLGGAPPEVLERLPQWTEDSFAGILLNVAAGRVANRFDLGGVNYTVDAACASSLAAVYLAASELDAGTSDMVIVGGVDTVQSPFGFLCFSSSQALSPRGRCRTFDSSADGIVISEGLSVLVLKRLADAERDGDRIYAVIKAVAGSSDGRGKSLTAPRPEGQALALERAYARADVSPASVGLVEAHGTGTVVGDAAEVAALADVFQAAGAAPASCAIGSVKSMIGHTKSAAGVTGLMKGALALHHKVLPPTLHVTSPNPRLREPDSPFFVGSEPLPWIAPETGTPRRAGVSSFGFGGANFHAVLEEYGGDFRDPATHRGADTWPAEVFVWSGATAEALDSTLGRLVPALEGAPGPRLRDLAAAVDAGVASDGIAEGWRLAIVATDREDLKKKLDHAREALRAERERLHDPRGVYLESGPRPAGKLAFLFPGQGSQAPDMLRDLAVHFPHIRRACEEADQVLQGRFEGRLSALIYPRPGYDNAERKARMAAITDTVVAQPALGAVELGLLHLLRGLGLEPDMVAGHSYGEYVALAAAGVMTERALLEISEARGRAIKESVGESPGTMAAVLASAERVAEGLRGLPEVWLANLNAPEQTIISGSPSGVKGAIDALASSGLRARPIPVACAFHTPLMAGARERLAGELSRLELQPPNVPVFSNTRAAPYPETAGEIAALLSEHVVTPVRFRDEVQAMYAHGARRFVEVGPKSVLSGLVRRVLDGKDDVLAVALDAPERNGLVQLLNGIAQLAVAGVGMRLERLFEGRPVNRVRLDRPAEAHSRPGWLVSGAGARRAGEARPLGAAMPPTATGTPPTVVAPVPVPTPAQPNSGDETIPATTPSLVGGVAPPPGGSAVMPAPVAAPPAVVAPVNGGAPTDPAPPTQAVLQQFQSLMSQFLETQGAVMTAYLQGSSEVPLPRMVEAPPPNVLARATDPMPETPPAVVPRIEEPSTVAAAPPPVAPRGDVGSELLQIVAERTGYPEAMLRPEAKIEADLGIDSIKRVEILSVFQRRCSAEEQEHVQAAMESLTRLSTLRELTEALAKATGNGASGSAAATSSTPSNGGGRDVAAALLEIVAERTGYPVAMLRPDVKIEADLGIDSIKRVEILGAFQQGCSLEEQQRVQQVMEQLTTGPTLREVGTVLEEALSSEAGGSPTNASPPEETGAAPPRKAVPAAARSEGVPRLTLRKVPAPLGDETPQPRPGRVWVLTDDEGGLAERVAACLAETDERAVLLRHRPGLGEPDAEAGQADLTRPEQVARVLEVVRRRHGPPAGLLHLLPLKAGGDFDELSMESWRARVQGDIKTLYALVRASGADLVAAGRAGGAMVLAGTSLHMPIDEPGAGRAPTHGGVTALLKTVAAEMPEVVCRAVHLEAGRPVDEQAAQVIGEIASPRGPVEVGYAGGQRSTLVAQRAPLPAGANGVEIGPEWVFLVTGGARGITAEIAAHLASAHRPTLVLAGLSPLPAEEPSDTRSISDPAALREILVQSMQAAHSEVRPADVEGALRRLRREREIRGNLETLRSSGARVEYHSVDVRDEAAFGKLIEDVYRTHGRLDAVIHGAGIIEDRLIRDKTADSFDRVVHTKTDSAFTLVRHLRPEGLKLLIFMSSVTATFGNRGQADYGAANGVLNALAGLLSARWPARVRALNWGPWDKTGMVSDAVRQQFEGRGIQVIPAAAGVAAAAQEMQAEEAAETVVVFGEGPWLAEAESVRPVEVPA